MYSGYRTARGRTAFVIDDITYMAQVRVGEHHDRTRTPTETASRVGSVARLMSEADNGTAHAPCVGGGRSDAIEKPPAATACGPEIRLASTRLGLLNRHDGANRDLSSWIPERIQSPCPRPRRQSPLLPAHQMRQPLSIGRLLQMSPLTPSTQLRLRRLPSRQ